MGIVEKDGKYLLVTLNKHLERFGGLYTPAGGHIEKGESREETLRRELKEEVGINSFDFKFLESTNGDIPNKILHWCYCKTNDSNLKINKREIKNAGFFTKEEISRMKLWPAVFKIFKKLSYPHCLL